MKFVPKSVKIMHWCLNPDLYMHVYLSKILSRQKLFSLRICSFCCSFFSFFDTFAFVYEVFIGLVSNWALHERRKQKIVKVIDQFLDKTKLIRLTIINALFRVLLHMFCYTFSFFLLMLSFRSKIVIDQIWALGSEYERRSYFKEGAGVWARLKNSSFIAINSQQKSLLNASGLWNYRLYSRPIFLMSL